MSNSFVSIVTPVYNGVGTIRQCIESVLSQTYQDWHYVIVDNCSDDGTGDAIAEYVSNEDRLTVVRHDTLLPVMDNLNFAMRQVSPDSTYCQVVHADDLLSSTCLERKVELADRYPSAAIIGSYAVNDGEIIHRGLPTDASFFQGHFLAGQVFRGRVFPFTTPTTLLLRSDVVRQRDPFYPNEYHGDQLACFELLKDYDFGLVHEPLVEVGADASRLTNTLVMALNKTYAHRLDVINRYGDDFLDNRANVECTDKILEAYYRFLAKSVVDCRGAEFWNFHRTALTECGYPISYRRLAGNVRQRLFENPYANLKQWIGNCVRALFAARDPGQ